MRSADRAPRPGEEREPFRPPSIRRVAPRRRSRWRWPLVVAASCLVLLFAATYFGDEPVRRAMEAKMNGKLKGYTASIGHAHLSLFGLSVTLRNVSVAQQANPDPPVISVPHLKASVQWKELLTLHLVADFLFDRPRLNVNRPQLLKEVADAVPVKRARLAGGGGVDLPAEDQPPSDRGRRTSRTSTTRRREPLRVTHLDVRATNIRNIHSKAHVYPSPVEATGVILGTGQGLRPGTRELPRGAFSRRPRPVRPERRPRSRRSGRSSPGPTSIVKGGIVSTSGEIESAPGIQLVHVHDLAVRKVTIDYIHTAGTAPEEKERVESGEKGGDESGRRRGDGPPPRPAHDRRTESSGS